MTLMDLTILFCSIFQLPLEISLTLSKVKVVSAVIGEGLLHPLILLACHNSLVSCCCADSIRLHVFLQPAAGAAGQFANVLKRYI